MTEQQAIMNQWHNGIISGVECILKLGRFGVNKATIENIEAESVGEYSHWPDRSGRTAEELARDAAKLDAYYPR